MSYKRAAGGMRGPDELGEVSDVIFISLYELGDVGDAGKVHF